MKFVFLAAMLSVCCYGQWITGYYQSNNGVEPVSALPWSKYTHVIHFAAAPGVGTDGNGNGTVNLQYLVPSEIQQLVSSKPSGKKALVVIADDGSHINAFAQNTAPGMISAFVNNIVTFVSNNGYDGVDIDWEANINVGQYVNLITLLRNAMPDKLITVAAGNWGGMQTAISSVSSYLDQVNVMCYDMDNNGSYSWHNDALLQAGDASLSSCDGRIKQIVAAGTPPAKIGVGIPFYGRRNVGVTQPGVTGSFQQFTVFYRNLASDSTRWQNGFMQYDTTHKADYLSIPGLNEFVSYNGTRSIGDTVAWAKTQGFGGFMTFVVDYEYLANQTGDARYPLSTALYQSVFGAASQNPPAAGPVLSAGSPMGTISASSNTATLSLATDVNASCSYSDAAATPYSTMPYTFAVTGGTQHSTTVTSLQAGKNYSYYVKCANTSGVSNSTDYVISFSVAAASIPTTPITAQITPKSGSGSSATFVFQGIDQKGYAAVQQLALMVGIGNPDHTCYASYWAPSRTLSLQNDTGTSATQAVLGSSTILKNSQCSLDAHAATISGSGNTTTLTLPVSFSNHYSGGKTIFTFVADAATWTGWQQNGSWTVK